MFWSLSDLIFFSKNCFRCTLIQIFRNVFMLKDETTHRNITFHVWVKRRISSRTGRPIMSFFLQLKLLVWKNYTLRKRQWVGICHVIKMWELFWIPFSGSITCRDCLATPTLSNSLPCKTQRAEKESPWMWVLSFEL